MSSYADIVYEVADPVALITLNRPEKLNAFTHPMLARSATPSRRAVADPAVVGIVITGAGRGFCAGLDASVLAATTAVGSSGRPPVADDELPGLFSYFTEQPKPIIAAVNGVVAGGGFVLASMCDLRFASTERVVHGRVHQAGPDRRARHDVDPAPPRRHRRRPRPAVVVAPLRRRRGRRGSASSSRSSRPTTCSTPPAPTSPTWPRTSRRWPSPTPSASSTPTAAARCGRPCSRPTSPRGSPSAAPTPPRARRRCSSAARRSSSASGRRPRRPDRSAAGPTPSGRAGSRDRDGPRPDSVASGARPDERAGQRRYVRLAVAWNRASCSAALASATITSNASHSTA